MPKTVGKKGGGKKKAGASKAKSRSKDKTKVKAKTKTEAVQDTVPKKEEEEQQESSAVEEEEEEDLEVDEFEEQSDEEADEILDRIMHRKSKTSLVVKDETEDSDESSWNDGDPSGSSSTGSDEPYCPSGEYASSGSSDLTKSVSSMTLITPQTGTTDACAILEDMEAGMVTKAALRKCRGIDVDNEEEESDVEEESNQKEAPDFNYMTSYEEYLDHYVTSKDLYYFDSDDVARTITTLGFRVPELLTRDQFAEVMKEIQDKRFAKRMDDIHVAYGIPPGEITCPLMEGLAAREIQNRTGNMACLIYIRGLNNKQQEVSAWIDFKLRLTKDGPDIWTDYFTGKRKLIPRPSDLCYYNWTNFQVRYNSSDNYLVTIDILEGLQFMNKLDMKLITVNPRVRPGDNTQLVKIKSPNYLDAGIYDHFLRIKA